MNKTNSVYRAKAYSAASATSPLAPTTTITRGDPTEHDVQIEILYCGICHCDLHQVRNERLLKSDVKYRFSIDMASLKSE